MISSNLRMILAKQKKRMSDVEKETGLSRNTIRGLYYETSKGVQFKTLVTLCKYLNCNVDDLLQFERSNLDD